MKKALTIFYKTTMSLIVLLVSIKLFDEYDLSNIFAFIPKGNVPLNVSFYTIVLTLFKSIIEMIIEDKMAHVEVTMSTKKNDSSDVPRTLTLKDNTPKILYLIISASGNLENLKDEFITITFPKGITVSRHDNKGLADQIENEIELNLSEITDAPGTTIFQIDVMRSAADISYTKKITCKLKSNSLFLSFTSNVIGVETEI